MDMLPQIGASLFMGAVVFCVQFLGFNSLITLLIQVPVGVVLYIGISKLFHIDSFEYVTSVIRGLFKRKNYKEEKE